MICRRPLAPTSSPRRRARRGVPPIRRLAALALVPGALAACSASEGPLPPTGELRIEAGALQLDDITDADYRLTVKNAKGDTVWTQQISSGDYGDGKGSATYVGPCDGAADAQPNSVQLDLLAIYTGPGGATTVPAGTYVNPTPLVQSVVCQPNADVLVTFNITVMRSATQGFFDIAVNFDDIFCSAKLDCQPQLLHDPDTGERELTAVVAFACTAGPGQDTTLYWGDVAIVCRDGNTVTATYPIDPAQPGGQHGPIFASGGQTEAGIYEHAIYLTDEQFEGQDIDKCAWSMALGLDLANLGKGCSFEAVATASAGDFEDPAFHTPPHTTYPLVTYQVPLTDKEGKLVCGKNALNGDKSGVTTKYTPLAGVPLAAKAGCGEDPETPGLVCSGTPGGALEPTFVADEDGKVTVTIGDKTFGPFALPADTVLAAECCADPCCEEAP